MRLKIHFVRVQDGAAADNGCQTQIEDLGSSTFAPALCDYFTQ